MRSYIVDAENGEFEVVGGHYGFRIIPTARRARRENAPAGTPEGATNPWVWGPRYIGNPGEFPVKLARLDLSSDESILTAADGIDSMVPMPAYRVFDAEPGSTWRVVLRESPDEIIRPSMQEVRGLLDLDIVTTEPLGSGARHIKLRSCYERLHLARVPTTEDITAVAPLVIYFSAGQQQYVYDVKAEAVSTDVPDEGPFLSFRPPPSGFLTLTHLEGAEARDVRVFATIRVG